ncbi:MAG: S8 family serine peptidase [Chloroflexota bacterium]
MARRLGLALAAALILTQAFIGPDGVPPTTPSVDAQSDDTSVAGRKDLRAQVNASAAAATDRVLVAFKSDVRPADQAAAHTKAGGTRVGQMGRVSVDVARVPQGSVQSALAKYRNDPNVLYAEPDFIGNGADDAVLTRQAVASGVSSSLTRAWSSNDPLGSSQWNLDKISVPSAWAKSKGSSSVKIAILDTGIDLDHEDLKGRVVATANFTSTATTTGSPCMQSTVSANDVHGHGTHVAGIAAASFNNGLGISGVAGQSSLMVAKVLDDKNTGYYSWWICGITWAVDNGAKVINLSLGGTASSEALRAAVDYAWSKGVVVVAAAGNQSSTSPFYPAYYTNAIAVGSTTSTDGLASTTNRGTWVDVSAPGVDILSTLPNHTNVMGKLNYGTQTGTSMASPHVAGIAALLWSSGASSASVVRSTIQSSADRISGTGTYFYYGRVNAAKALGVTAPVATPTPTSKPIPTATPNTTSSGRGGNGAALSPSTRPRR